MACQQDPNRNLEKALAGVDEAASKGAQIICLQELFLTPYFCQIQDPSLFELAEPIPGPTTDALASCAKKTAAL